MLAAPLQRRKPFEACVALLQRKIDPSAILETPRVIVFLDDALVGAIGVLLRLDHQVEAVLRRAVGDRFVALSVSQPAGPIVIVGALTQMHRDARDTPDVVERDEALLADDDRAAGLEDGTLPCGLEEIGDLALLDESKRGSLGHRSILPGT